MPSIAPEVEAANIFIAAADGDLVRVTALLDSGISPNDADSSGYTPLHAATSYDHQEILKLLLARGGNANITDDDGDTPLHVSETVECVQILLAAGADPTQKNQEGKSPAEVAAEEGREEVHALLSSTYPDTFDASRVTLPTDEDEAFQARFKQLLQAAEAGDESKEADLVEMVAQMVEDGTVQIRTEEDTADEEASA